MALGAVHRPVGAGDQVVGGVSRAADGDADADPDRQGSVGARQGCAHRGDDPIGQPPQVRRSGSGQRITNSSPPKRATRSSGPASPAIRRAVSASMRIAHRVAVLVVDVLEPVEVAEQQGAAGAGVEPCPQRVEQRAAVGQPGEQVGLRPEVQLRLAPPVVGHVEADAADARTAARLRPGGRCCASPPAAAPPHRSASHPPAGARCPWPWRGRRRPGTGRRAPGRRRRPTAVPADLGRTPTGTATTQAALGRTLLDLTAPRPEAAPRGHGQPRRQLVDQPRRLGQQGRRLVGTGAHRLVRRRRRDDPALARAPDHGQHIELGIAETNLVGLLGELGATWSRGASRCCRSARSTTRSSSARWSRGRSASTPAASRSSSARRPG
jgi:hypothetical protein